MTFLKGLIQGDGFTPGPQKGGKRQFSSQSGLPLALVIAAGLIGPAAMNAQTTASDGAMVLRGLTLPRGGVWLANSAGGGHFWVPDGVLGFCRVDPAPGANPPFTTS